MKFPPKIKVPYVISDIKERIAKKKNFLDGCRPIPRAVIDRLRNDFTIEWTYNSNSIEGNTLTLAETQIIIEHGMTIGGKSLREHLEVINHEKAIKYIETLVKGGEDIRSLDILSIHKLVMNNVMDDFAGRLRPGMVRIVGANFVPPNARKVPDMLDELVHYIQDNPDGHDLLTLATIFHHRFVWIHPFNDGNGRTIRLAMNILLMRGGYPPVFILARERKKYISALNAANKGDYHKLLLMMHQAAERSLNIFINSLGGDYDDYLPTADIAKDPDVPYSQEYLSLLARRGRIDACKDGRAWLTTKAAVKSYQQNKLK